MSADHDSTALHLHRDPCHRPPIGHTAAETSSIPGLTAGTKARPTIGRTYGRTTQTRSAGPQHAANGRPQTCLLVCCIYASTLANLSACSLQRKRRASRHVSSLPQDDSCYDTFTARVARASAKTGQHLPIQHSGRRPGGGQHAVASFAASRPAGMPSSFLHLTRQL